MSLESLAHYRQNTYCHIWFDRHNEIFRYFQEFKGHRERKREIEIDGYRDQDGVIYFIFFWIKQLLHPSGGGKWFQCLISSYPDRPCVRLCTWCALFHGDMHTKVTWLLLAQFLFLCFRTAITSAFYAMCTWCPLLLSLHWCGLHCRTVPVNIKSHHHHHGRTPPEEQSYLCACEGCSFTWILGHEWSTKQPNVPTSHLFPNDIEHTVMAILT